jgi:hypothetical protein
LLSEPPFNIAPPKAGATAAPHILFRIGGS